MASSDVLSRTLHSITETKLAEIEKQRTAFETGKKDLFAKVDAEDDRKERVNTLLEGFSRLPLMDQPGGTSTPHDNVKRFVKQAKHDPSVSDDQLQKWEKQLKDELNVQSSRYEYASLYGRLVNEWLADSSSDKRNVESEGESGSFEKLGRKEKHEQRKTWEEYVFKPLKVESAPLLSYLDSLFGSSKEIKAALTEMRKSIDTFGSIIAKDKIDRDDLDWCIKGILRSDLLTDEKRKILEDFKRNKVVLKEICDVLNMRLASLDIWSWGSEGIPVEQRRQLNGRYRFYHDEDLLHSIFLRYIGVKWSVLLKRTLTRFYNVVSSWSSPVNNKLTSEQRKRIQYFLKMSTGSATTYSKCERIYEDDVFLEQLQKEDDDVGPGYDDDSSAADDTKNLKSPQQITQSVIRLLATDIAIETRFGNDVTAVRSDFKWFGPSLPHDTMFIILKYFGVSDRWLDFFKRSLEPPMQFVEDGPDAPVQVRKRGTHLSAPMSDMLAESVLFCLDFAFNQKTEGATTLYRLHDDIWFWGSKEACEKGWEVLTEFTRLTGLELNKEKTGSVEVRCSSSTASTKSTILPTGPVGWGFLQLNSEGRFIIDQSSVKQHIEELKLQLSACKSVFDYIQAWNIYATRFFTVNFGKPCNVFGPKHVDEILQTFQDIQASLFGPKGSVTAKVKAMLLERFNVENIPEGYLYFALHLGGLDLKSPFIGPYLIREAIKEPSKILDKFLDEEEATYNRLARSFDSESHTSRRDVEKPKDADKFMTFDEFKSYRQFISVDLGRAFDELMAEPDTCVVTATKEVKASCRDWQDMDDYRRWVTALYGNDMIQRFGGLSVVDKGLLPIGMVGMFRQSRFQWQG